MPELPEVETIRRDLAACVVGETVEHVVWLDGRMVRGPVRSDELAARLVGQRGCQVVRRGKFLVWKFASRAGLLLHLGMSGRLVVEANPTAVWRPHTHLVLDLSSGAQVRLSDPRRFGRVTWLEPPARLPWPLGPEPLSRTFTASRLEAVLAHRQAPIKALLLDQRIVAGLGNIYVDEALHRASVSTRQPGGTLQRDRVVALHRAIRHVLREAIADRGTTFLDYRDGRGEAGSHQRRLKVYGRAGEPCQRCGQPIARIVVAGRGTHLCPRCQQWDTWDQRPPEADETIRPGAALIVEEEEPCAAH